MITDCMTEASKESKRNRPYFQHIISEHLAVEKTICNRKKIIAHASELQFVLGKVTKHGAVMCIL